RDEVPTAQTIAGKTEIPRQGRRSDSRRRSPPGGRWHHHAARVAGITPFVIVRRDQVVPSRRDRADMARRAFAPVAVRGPSRGPAQAALPGPSPPTRRAGGPTRKPPGGSIGGSRWSVQ